MRHTMTLLVVLGAIIKGNEDGGKSLYHRLIDFTCAGVPITSFGNALVHGALVEINNEWLNRGYYLYIQSYERRDILR